MPEKMQNGMDKQTIKDMDQNDKLNVIVDYLTAIDERTQNIENNRQEDVGDRKEHCKQQKKECDDRFIKIERVHYGIIGVLVFVNAVISPTVYILWS